MIIYVIREGKTFYLMVFNWFSYRFSEKCDNAKLFHDEKDAYSELGKLYITLIKKKEKIDDIGIQYDDKHRKSINDFIM